MKKLPIGIQTFSEIIEGGYVYADKTRFIHDMVEDGKFFFLSRPRRFGKSLLVDTMKEAFEGNRTLFEGLYLGDSDFDFAPHPVIRLDMSLVNLASRDSLRAGVVRNLGVTARAAGIEIQETDPAGFLQLLIIALREQTGQRVVVLVDEYDKPIIEHLSDPKAAEANRAELRSLYGVLKGMDAQLRFVFLTGVSKFTRTSIFSQLNNLIDISLDPLYASICGFSDKEFDKLFHDRLPGLEIPGIGSDLAAKRQAVFDWYDGYSWDGQQQVFNPFSLLSFMRRGELYPFWFSTGVPQFLVDWLKRHPADYATANGAEITELFLDSHDIEKASFVSLLFQTGFLTVGAVDRLRSPAVYTLRYPNEEVSTSFSRSFLDAIVGAAGPSAETWYRQLEEALDQGRPEYLKDCLAGLFASIPYQLHVPVEAFYHAIFLAVMLFLGLRVTGEGSVAGGRIDGVINRRTGRSYILELKYVKAGDAQDTGTLLDCATQDALAQIDERGYADAYRGTGREVYKVGIAVAGRGDVRVRVDSPDGRNVG